MSSDHCPRVGSSGPPATSRPTAPAGWRWLTGTGQGFNLDEISRVYSVRTGPMEFTSTSATLLLERPERPADVDVLEVWCGPASTPVESAVESALLPSPTGDHSGLGFLLRAPGLVLLATVFVVVGYFWLGVLPVDHASAALLSGRVGVATLVRWWLAGRGGAHPGPTGERVGARGSRHRGRRGGDGRHHHHARRRRPGLAGGGRHRGPGPGGVCVRCSHSRRAGSPAVIGSPHGPVVRGCLTDIA